MDFELNWNGLSYIIQIVLSRVGLSQLKLNETEVSWSDLNVFTLSVDVAGISAVGSMRVIFIISSVLT